MPAQPIKASVLANDGSATNITASASQALGNTAPAANSADGGAAGAVGGKRCRRFIPFSDGVRAILRRCACSSAPRNWRRKASQSPA